MPLRADLPPPKPQDGYRPRRSPDLGVATTLGSEIPMRRISRFRELAKATRSNQRRTHRRRTIGAPARG